MASLAASAHRAGAMLPAERWPLLLAGWSGIAALIARPGLLGLRVQPLGPIPVAHVVFLLSAATYAIAVAAGRAPVATRPPAPRPPRFFAAELSCPPFPPPRVRFSCPH